MVHPGLASAPLRCRLSTRSNSPTTGCPWSGPWTVRSRLCQWRAELSRRVGKVVGYPPLCDMSEHQPQEFHEALLEAGRFEDLPGKWQAAILMAERNRPSFRIVTSD
jgi:hypothetical protein